MQFPATDAAAAAVNLESHANQHQCQLWELVPMAPRDHISSLTANIISHHIAIPRALFLHNVNQQMPHPLSSLTTRDK